MSDSAAAARPREDVLREVLDPCRPKSEHEWVAAREIERLRAEIRALEQKRVELNVTIGERDAEIERLRAEVGQLTNLVMHFSGRDQSAVLEMIGYSKDAACELSTGDTK